MFEKAQLEKILSKLHTLDPQTQRQLWASLSAEVLARCTTDGLFWLRFVNTRDEADPTQAVKPIPLKEYVTNLWTDYSTEQVCVIAKSRQMMVSWLTCAFCVYWARFKPHQAIYWQTKAWTDAVRMTAMPAGGVSGRCQFIEENLPTWMQLDCKFSEGRIQYPNGSIIQALSGGADQVRSLTGSVFVEDEFAHAEEQEGVYTALAPLIQKGAKAIFVSTPNGSSNMFATLFHGRPVGELGAGELAHG